MISLKQKVSLKDIAIRFCLLFAWFPVGIILLVKSKTIKHKVCIGFIYLSLYVCFGLPIVVYIAMPISAIVDGYDISHGLTYADDFANQIYDLQALYFVILIFSLLIYIIQLIRDRIRAKKTEQNEQNYNANLSRKNESIADEKRIYTKTTNISDDNFLKLARDRIEVQKVGQKEQNYNVNSSRENEINAYDKLIYPKTTKAPDNLIYKSISNIFELKVGDMITDSVYGAGIIVDIYKSENELFFDVNFINSGRMTFNPCFRTLAKIQNSNVNLSQTPQINNNTSVKIPPPIANYKKANLLTNNEQIFYKAIRLIAEKYNFTVLSKVRLADIAKVNPALDNAEWWSNFGKVKSKHIDFALAKKENLDVVLIIELDDSTHSKSDRIERDAFVDSVFREIGIPILHVYNAVGLENKIISALDLSPSENYNTQKNGEI